MSTQEFMVTIIYVCICLKCSITKVSKKLKIIPMCLNFGKNLFLIIAHIYQVLKYEHT